MSHQRTSSGSWVAGSSAAAWESTATYVGPNELAALYDASALLSQSLDLQKTQEAIVVAARHHFGFDRAGLWIYHRETGRVQGAVGTDEHLNLRREDHVDVPLEEIPPSTRAVITGEAPFYFTDDLQREFPSHPNPTMRGVSYNAVVPLRSGDDTLGFLSVDNLISETPITEAHVRLLLLYANYAAAALKSAMNAERARDHLAEVELRLQLERKIGRLRHVHELAAAITSLHLDAVLRLVRNRIVEEFGFDRAGILLLDSHDTNILRGTWGTDPSGQIIDEHDVVFYVDRHDDLTALMSGDSPYLLRHWDMDFAKPVDREIAQHMVILLRSSQKRLGVLSVDNLVTGRPITEDDVEALLLIAEHAALAIQKAHLFSMEQDAMVRLRNVLSRESRIATTLQKTFKPTVGPYLHGMRIAHLYRPAMTEADLGGDFYDVLDLGKNRIGLVMADVSGKGLKAAARTARARFALQAYAFEDPDPLSVLPRLNHFLCSPMAASLDEEGFLTMFYGVLNAETGELHCASAGHELPLFIPEEGEPDFLEVSGLPLGLFEMLEMQDYHLTLQPGDRFLLYSDGVTEARQNRILFESEGLLDVVKRNRQRPVDSLVRRLYAHVLKYSGGVMRDDVALLMVEWEKALTG